MKKNTGMNFFQLHFMDHGFYGMRIQFIDKNGIVVMHIRLDHFVDIIAKEKGFVVEVDFYDHDARCWMPGLPTEALVQVGHLIKIAEYFK